MIEINTNEDIKTQLERNHLVTPIKKKKGWGCRGSSVIDRQTEKESLNALLKYLKNHNLIVLKGGILKDG